MLCLVKHSKYMDPHPVGYVCLLPLPPQPARGAILKAAEVELPNPQAPELLG